MVCFGYIIVNTMHKGGCGGGDDNINYKNVAELRTNNILYT